mmetsp:Transcript_88642/g.171650  ORF Transcript_88642/g.171650 Transcript_88642/m.171650 type:complete len:289 (+) Transcript_88642:105-971(+)
MHRRRKREHSFRKERFCSICHGLDSALLAGQTLKMNVVEAQLRCCHDFCSTCLAKKFDTAGSFPCPKCNQNVATRTLTDKTLAEHDAQRHRDIRARVGKIRNKSLNEFKSQTDWDDYLSESEELAWDLFMCHNVQETEALLKKYERDPINEWSLNESRRTSQRADAKSHVDQELKARKASKMKAALEDFAADNGGISIGEAGGGAVEALTAPFDLALTQPMAVRCHPLQTHIRKSPSSSSTAGSNTPPPSGMTKRASAGGSTPRHSRTSTKGAFIFGFGVTEHEHQAS